MALAQDQQRQQILSEALSAYTGSNAQDAPGTLAGFSVAGLIGTLVFSGIGFVAFVYGKKNTEIKPLLFGLGLMVYPYFFKSALAIYAIGVALTACVFFFRE